MSLWMPRSIGIHTRWNCKLYTIGESASCRGSVVGPCWAGRRPRSPLGTSCPFPCHFVLLLGLVYNSARAESETYAACIDTNISLSNITCLRNLEAIEAAQITQTLSTWIIFGIVILALGGALLLIYFQLQHALQALHFMNVCASN